MDDQTKKQIQTAAEALLKANEDGTLTSVQCEEFLEKYGKTFSTDFTADEQQVWLRVREAIAVANDLLASDFEFTENPENASTAAQPNPAETAEAAPVANPPAGTSGSTPSAESSSAGGWSLMDTAAEAWDGFKKAAAPIVEPVVEAVTEAPAVKEAVTRAYIQNKLAEYGIEPESSRKFLDLLKDHLGVTASMIGSFAGGTKDFFAEAFSSKELYSAASPLYAQSSDRLFANHRGKALADLSERQTQNGIRNLKKLFPSMSDVSARGIVGFMESGLPKAVIDGMLPAAFQQFGDQGGQMYRLFKENYNGILHGFQGDGVQFFDTLARGNYSPGDNMAFGTAAQLASRGPSADNYFAKAENYTAALERMKAQGFRPEAHLIRGDNDLVRLTGELTEADRQQYIKQEKARAVESALRTANRDVVYNENGEIVMPKDDEELTVALVYAEARAESQAQVALADPLKAASAQRASLQAFASGAALHKRTDERQKAEQMVSQTFSWVPGAQKVFGGQPVDQRAAQQLIAVLGGSDPNGNYMDYARRAVEIGQIAANNDMDLERVISGVSEAGRYGQSLGLSPESVQSTALMGMRMFDNALANTGRSDFVDKDALFALSMQNATRVSASRQAETITWLMNADVTGKAATIKNRLNKGKALTNGDLEYLDNRENLRKDFNGTELEFTASWEDTALSVARRRLTHEQNTAVQQNALKSNQNGLLKLLESRSTSFTNGLTERVYRSLGYRSKEDVWDLSKNLLKAGFSDDKIRELVSGSRELTDTEREQLQRSLPAEATEIIGQLTTARTKAKDDTANSDYMSRQVESGLEAVSRDVGIGSAENLTLALTPWNEKLQRQRSIQEHLQESVPMNQRTAVETFFNTEGGWGKGAGAFVKALFGGSGVTPEAVQGLVGDDHRGIQALLYAASRDAKTKEDFFKVLTNSENTKEWEELAKEAGYKDSSGNANPDAMFNAVQSADVKELTDISARVAGTKAGRGIEKLIRETDYNQVRTWKRLPFQSFADELTEPSESSEAASKETSENASMESVPDFINLEAPATNPSEVTPADESSDASGTGGQTAANRRGSTENNPLFVSVTNAVSIT